MTVVGMRLFNGKPMPKWIVAAVVAVWLCTPGFAFAQPDQGQSGTIAGVSNEQALVVGAGVIAGALILHFVVPGDLTYFAGGVVGGLAALWWYEDGGEASVRPLLKLNRTGAAAYARGGPILDGVALGR